MRRNALLVYGITYKEPRNFQYSRLHAVINDHVIEVFKSAGALVIGIQVPSQHTGSKKSWVRISGGSEEAIYVVLTDEFADGMRLNIWYLQREERTTKNKSFSNPSI